MSPNVTTTLHAPPRQRSTERMPDGVWNALLIRVRGEFDEMPCLRVTNDQARMLFGLREPTAQWVLDRLVADGFLARTDQGEYVRRQATP